MVLRQNSWREITNHVGHAPQLTIIDYRREHNHTQERREKKFKSTLLTCATWYGTGCMMMKMAWVCHRGRTSARHYVAVMRCVSEHVVFTVDRDFVAGWTMRLSSLSVAEDVLTTLAVVVVSVVETWRRWALSFSATARVRHVVTLRPPTHTVSVQRVRRAFLITHDVMNGEIAGTQAYLGRPLHLGPLFQPTIIFYDGILAVLLIFSSKTSKFRHSVTKKRQLLGDFVPHTPYQGFAPGPHQTPWAPSFRTF